MGVSDTIGKELRDKNDFKAEKNLGTKKSEVLVLRKRKVKPVERHLIVYKRDTSTDTIWGRFEWGNANWDGSYDNEYQVIRVVNPNRTYIDNLHSTTFKDTSSTATWTGTGEISFGTSSATALSTSIYKNNETVSSATLTATETGSGSLTYYLSADTGSNWETVTNGEEHTFTNTGQDLRWKASGSDKTITKMKVEY